MWQWDNTDPYGNNVPNENPSNLGQFSFNLRFPGQYFDNETGLAYNRFRDYNAAIGGYIESDPIGLLAGVNTYTYVNGDPLSRIDPFGLRDSQDSTTKDACDALHKMIDYFNQHTLGEGTRRGGPYAALNTENLDYLNLNVPYSTTLGPIDADWMLRSFAWGTGANTSSANVNFYSAKLFWNWVYAIQGKGHLTDEFDDPSYTNAPKAMVWLIDHRDDWPKGVKPPPQLSKVGGAMEQLFAPALEKCKCKGY